MKPLENNQPAGAVVLRGDGLGAAYGRIRVVEDVALQLSTGEVVVLLGANGAGKSSLLGSIAGVVRGSGQLSLGQQALSGLSGEARAARGLALVPERRGNVFSAMTVEENLQVGLRLSPAARRKQILDNTLALFPILKERMQAKAGMLSGGEQQMLAIGMALGREPRVLLLDEPSQGLAPVVFDLLNDAFSALRQQGLALLVAEQNLPFASQIADRYLVIAHGHLVSEGPGEALHGIDDLMSLLMGEEA